MELHELGGCSIDPFSRVSVRFYFFRFRIKALAKLGLISRIVTIPFYMTQLPFKYTAKKDDMVCLFHKGVYSISISKQNELHLVQVQCKNTNQSEILFHIYLVSKKSAKREETSVDNMHKFIFTLYSSIPNIFKRKEQIKILDIRNIYL